MYIPTEKSRQADAPRLVYSVALPSARVSAHPPRALRRLQEAASWLGDHGEPERQLPFLGQIWGIYGHVQARLRNHPAAGAFSA